MWACCSCAATFSSRDHLVRHMVRTHNSDLTTTTAATSACSLCCCSVEQHLTPDNGRALPISKTCDDNTVATCPEFICFYCNARYADKTSLTVHIKILHAHGVYTTDLSLEWYACVSCCKLYTRAQDIVKHVRRVHRKRNVSSDTYRLTELNDVRRACEECGQYNLLSRICRSHKRYLQTKIESKRRGERKRGRRPRRRCGGENHNEVADCVAHETTLSERCHTCADCHTKHADCVSLWAHILSSHARDSYDCNLCVDSNPFSDSSLVRKHLQRFHNVWILPEKRVRKEHSSVLIDGMLHFRCSHCSLIFWSFYKLSEHTLQSHADVVYKCVQCSKVYAEEEKLNSHVARVHCRKQAEKTVQCQYCGGAFEKSNFSRHLAIHTGEKKFVCELCGARFTQSSILYMHKFTHTNTKYECAVCSKHFNTPRILHTHVKAHYDTNVYVCETCGKKFASRAVWKSHVKIHSTERPYVCDVCNASFVVKKYLTQHSRTHTKQTK